MNIASIMDKRPFINYCYVTFVWLFCLILSTTIIGAYSFNNGSSIEREALIVFKQGLLDPSGRLSSWAGLNYCEWHGITCDPTSRKVTKIDLRNPFGSTIFQFVESGDNDRPWIDPADFLPKYDKTCLGGEISSSLVELKYLSYLDLSWNNFEGAQIPPFFGMLKSLRYLNLHFANFSGSIPIHLRNLSNLDYLDLSCWKVVFAHWPTLQVENLQWLHGISSLKYLNLGGVDFSSVQPNWMHPINELSSLLELHLNDCGISSFDTSVAFLNLSSLRVLDLSVNEIKSSLPLWLSNLISISTLDLSFNYFQGTPHSMKLKNLQYLDLTSGNNSPKFLLNLCKLRFFNLAYNSFNVKLEEFLNNFSNCTRNRLESLDLGANEFVGEIPKSLGTFKNLRFLNLSQNHLWGSIPTSISNMSLLQHLHVSYNSLNGTITEAHLVNLTKLEILEIRINNKHALVFDISSDWIPPFKLKTLNLRNCLIGSQFPVWLQAQTHLTNIILSNVGIYGSLPNKWVSNISSRLFRLDLSYNLLNLKLSHIFMFDPKNPGGESENNLTDLIPLKYPNLRYLILRNNQFSGHIPLNIDYLMPNLYELDLSNNDLNGTIPSSIKKMNYLKVLSMSDNQLSGGLFEDWSRLKSLFVVDLANNNLQGKIPTTIGFSSLLNILMLSNNNLQGEIPKSLQNCSHLTSIDLSRNRLLYGSLPSWIGVALLELQLLNLRSNRFNGTIPREWCNLFVLRIVDLSNNYLSGEIPSCLSNWTSFVQNHNNYIDLRHYHYFYKGSVVGMPYDENTRLVMKGKEYEYNNNLNNVLTIDLSQNKLSGEIPNAITKLRYLITLNLSGNALVGTIPQNIGAMQNLETLDISNNHLSGRIPVSLASLHFLTNLNVSFNNLTGRIPTGNQLQTLEDHSIYEGNPYLCGSPLQIMCPGDHESLISNEEEDEEENEFEMVGLFISMGIGFPVGINILFFTIFTNRARRIIYFRFVDGVNNNILQTVNFLTISLRRMIIWRRSY